MKKYLPYILIFIALVGLFSPTFKIQAQSAPSTPASNTKNTNYQLLAPLPCEYGDLGCSIPDGKGGYELKTFDASQPNNMGVYLNLMIKLFIGLCAVLSVVMIIIGGLEYMTSELVHTKEAGKEKIVNALLGLLIALGAYTLLYTINPDLLNSDLCISPQVMKDGKCITPSPAVTPPATITPLQTPNSGSTTNNVTPININTPATPVNTPAGTQGANPPPSQQVQTANTTDLNQYNQNINNGVFTGNRDLIIARVIDLATKSGVTVYQNSNIQFSSQGDVPTTISIDGQNVPINQSNYTQAESNAIRTAQSAGRAMGN
jgi:hypothetical protein